MMTEIGSSTDTVAAATFMLPRDVSMASPWRTKSVDICKSQGHALCSCGGKDSGISTTCTVLPCLPAECEFLRIPHKLQCLRQVVSPCRMQCQGCCVHPPSIILCWCWNRTEFEQKDCPAPQCFPLTSPRHSLPCSLPMWVHLSTSSARQPRAKPNRAYNHWPHSPRGVPCLCGRT